KKKPSAGQKTTKPDPVEKKPNPRQDSNHAGDIDHPAEGHILFSHCCPPSWTAPVSPDAMNSPRLMDYPSTREAYRLSWTAALCITAKLDAPLPQRGQNPAPFLALPCQLSQAADIPPADRGSRNRARRSATAPAKRDVSNGHGEGAGESTLSHSVPASPRRRDPSFEPGSRRFLHRTFACVQSSTSRAMSRLFFS